MARSYSTRELLNMRDMLPLVICDLDKMNPEIASEIITVQVDARSDSKSHMYKSKDLKGKSRVRDLSCSDTVPSRPDTARSRSENLYILSSSEDEEDQVTYGGHPTLRDTQIREWQLRKRNCSDRSSQPYPAPSGVAAQKADNFRKFYQAVVSPTHVRVTAGGRIVPNTRALTQPPFFWNPEKKFFDPISREPTPEKQGAWLQGVKLPMYPNVSQPASANIFGPHLDFRGSSTSAGQPTNQNINYAAVGGKSTAGNKDLAEESHITAVDGGIQLSPPTQFDTSRPYTYNGQLLYPLPSGFQIPANMPILPFNILGNHGASQQSFGPPRGLIPSAPLPFPTGNLHYPQAMPLLGQQTSQQVPLINIPMFASTTMPSHLESIRQPSSAMSMLPAAPLLGQPVGMLSAPAMLANQIQSLQQQLKHIDNQLQNNKHQIDEQHVMNQQNYVQAQIAALKFHLDVQMSQPSSLSHEQSESSIWNAGLGLMGAPGAPPKNSWNLQDTTHVIEDNAVTATGNQSAAYGFPDSAKAEPVKTQASSIAGSYGQGSPAKFQLSSRKRLPAAAAMAPPFQPRAQQSITALIIDMKDKPPATEDKAADMGDKAADVKGNAADMKGNAVDMKGKTANVKGKAVANALDDDPEELGNPNESRAEIEARLLSRASNWANPSHLATSVATHDLSRPPSFPKPHMMQGVAGSNIFNGLSAGSRKPTPFCAPDGAGLVDSSAGDSSPDATPYLLGFAPPGSSLERVDSSDLVYSRPLTEQERRARHLYWGKAPREVSKGLPKFDGRDFYPPSPAKASAILVPNLDYRNHFKLGFNNSNTFHQQPLSNLKHNQRTLRSRRGSSIVSDPFNDAGGARLPSFDTDASHGKAAAEDGAAMVAADQKFPRSTCQPPTFIKKESSWGSVDFACINTPTTGRPASFTQGQPSILQGMLRNSPRTAMAAATGALSAATAHGYLPQYGGSAAASLAPSMTNVAASSPGHNVVGKAARPSASTSVQPENRPLSNIASLQDIRSAAHMLRKVNHRERTTPIPGFDPNTTGVGPVYGGADW